MGPLSWSLWYGRPGLDSFLVAAKTSRNTMIVLLLMLGGAVAQRGHYIVDYQRLPLYQEFYLSPGLYRPLFPAKGEQAAPVTSGVQARRIDSSVLPTARHHKHGALQQAVQQHNHRHDEVNRLQPQQQVQQQQPIRQQQQLESSSSGLTQQQQTAPQPQSLVQDVQDNSVVTVSAAAPQHDQQQQLSQPQQQPVVLASTSAIAPQVNQVVAVSAQPEQVAATQQQQPLGVPVLTYSNAMSHDGSYNYKYETADGLMREESSVMEPAEDGRMVATVRGSYSYPGPDGRTIRVDYVADEGGFRASGDHLPQSLADTVYNFKYVIP